MSAEPTSYGMLCAKCFKKVKTEYTHLNPFILPCRCDMCKRYRLGASVRKIEATSCPT